MTQDQLIILLYKIVLLTNIASILAFIAIYTKLAPWWENVIGRSIVFLDVLLGMAFIPSTISLFWSFNRLTSYIAAWVDIGIFILIAGGMVWRSIRWIQIHKDSRKEESSTEES